MMSPILIENIFMSPSPSESVTPTMSRIQSPSLDNGEYPLGLSLHPSPLSLWLDFRYKEKKKSDTSGKGGGRNTSNSTNDTKLFCFGVPVRVQIQAPVPGTVLYFCQKLFSSHLSRNYRYCKNKHDVFTNTENPRTVCTEIFPVNYVLTPTNSRMRQNKVRNLQMAYSVKYLRIWQTELALLMLRLKRHAVFENQNFEISALTTNLINNLVIGDNNTYRYRYRDTTSDSDILQLQYQHYKYSLYKFYRYPFSIIDRVFQIDGEWCIVIRLSDLIDQTEEWKRVARKKEKNRSPSKRIDQLPIVSKKEATVTKEVETKGIAIRLSILIDRPNEKKLSSETGESSLVRNKINNNDVSDNIDNKSVLFLLSIPPSKLLNNDNNNNENTSVLFLLSIPSLDLSKSNDEDKGALTIQVLLNRPISNNRVNETESKRKKKPLSIYILILLSPRIHESIFVLSSKSGECKLIAVLLNNLLSGNKCKSNLILLSKLYNCTDDLNVLILLSKPPNRTVHYEEKEDEGDQRIDEEIRVLRIDEEIHVLSSKTRESSLVDNCNYNDHDKYSSANNARISENNIKAKRVEQVDCKENGWDKNNFDGGEGFSSDNEKCIDYAIILLSKLLNNKSDDDNVNNDNTSVLFLLLKRIGRSNQVLLNRINVINFHENSINNDDDRSANDNRIDPDKSVLNLLILKVSTHRTDTNCEVNSINDSTIDRHEVVLLLFSTRFTGGNDNIDVDVLILQVLTKRTDDEELLLLLSTRAACKDQVLLFIINNHREEEQEEDERYTISVYPIDGECILVLLSKLSIRTYKENNNKDSNIKALLLLSNRDDRQDRKKKSSKIGESSLSGNDDTNDNEKCIDYMLILLSEPPKCYDNEDNEKNDYDNKKHIITTTTLTTYFDSSVCHDIDINNKKKTILYDNISIYNDNNVSTKLNGSSINYSNVPIIQVLPSKSNHRKERDNNNNIDYKSMFDDGNNEVSVLILIRFSSSYNCNDYMSAFLPFSNKLSVLLPLVSNNDEEEKYIVILLSNNGDNKEATVTKEAETKRAERADDEGVLLSLWPIPGECKENSSVDRTMSNTDNNNCIYNNTYDCACYENKQERLLNCAGRQLSKILNHNDDGMNSINNHSEKNSITDTQNTKTKRVEYVDYKRKKKLSLFNDILILLSTRFACKKLEKDGSSELIYLQLERNKEETVLIRNDYKYSLSNSAGKHIYVLSVLLQQSCVLIIIPTSNGDEKSNIRDRIDDSALISLNSINNNNTDDVCDNIDNTKSALILLLSLSNNDRIALILLLLSTSKLIVLSKRGKEEEKYIVILLSKRIDIGDKVNDSIDSNNIINVDVLFLPALFKRTDDKRVILLLTTSFDGDDEEVLLLLSTRGACTDQSSIRDSSSISNNNNNVETMMSDATTITMTIIIDVIISTYVIKKEISMWKMMRDNDTDNNNIISQISLSTGNLCPRLFYLPLTMGSYYVVIRICIRVYKYDTIHGALFIFHCSILLDLHNRWGVTSFYQGSGS